MPDAPQTRGQHIAKALWEARDRLYSSIARLPGHDPTLRRFPDPDAIGEVVDALAEGVRQADESIEDGRLNNDTSYDNGANLERSRAALARLDEVKT